MAKYYTCYPRLWVTLGDSEHPAVCYISHIGGGEHHPNFTVLGKTLCEASWRWHGRDAKGQKQHE